MLMISLAWGIRQRRGTRLQSETKSGLIAAIVDFRWVGVCLGGSCKRKPLRLAAVVRGRPRGERRERPSRLRQLRSQPRGLARRHDHEHRLRESPRVRLFRGDEPRRHESREALRDARRDGAAPLGLVGRDVQGRRADQDRGRAGSVRRELVLRAHGRVRRRHDGRSLRAALEARRDGGAGRAARGAPAERRAEHHGRLGARASRHDGSARPQRCARAREPRRGVRAGHARRRRRPVRGGGAGGGGRAARARRPTPTAGQAAADAFRNGTTDNPRMRCETTSILFDWTFDGPVNRITQSGDTITLQYGQLGLTRTIHMNMTEHPANVERTPRGSLDRPLGERRARRRHGRLRAGRA